VGLQPDASTEDAVPDATLAARGVLHEALGARLSRPRPGPPALLDRAFNTKTSVGFLIAVGLFAAGLLASTGGRVAAVMTGTLLAGGVMAAWAALRSTIPDVRRSRRRIRAAKALVKAAKALGKADPPNAVAQCRRAIADGDPLIAATGVMTLYAHVAGWHELEREISRDPHVYAAYCTYYAHRSEKANQLEQAKDLYDLAADSDDFLWAPSAMLWRYRRMPPDHRPIEVLQDLLAYADPDFAHEVLEELTQEVGDPDLAWVTPEEPRQGAAADGIHVRLDRT
jgi:hypothetical protein